MQGLFSAVWTQTCLSFQISGKGKQSTHTSCYHWRLFLISAERCRHKIEIKGCSCPYWTGFALRAKGAREITLSVILARPVYGGALVALAFPKSFASFLRQVWKKANNLSLPKDGLICPSQTKSSVPSGRSMADFATDSRTSQKQDYTGPPPPK